jgi:non-canonical (house-cleaning) NTP pyrophosphatase
MDLVMQGVELSTAWEQLGWHEGVKLGYGQGSVGALTGGIMPRSRQIKHGVIMALLQLGNPEKYLRK